MAKEKKIKKPKKARIIFHFQVGLIWFLILTVIIVAALIYFPWYFISTSNISQLVSDLNQEIMKGIKQEITKLFNNALNIQYTIKDAFENGIIDINDKQQREQYYLGLLKAYPNFTWISFGFPDGSFFGVQRENPDSLNVIDNVWQGEVEKATRRIDFYKRNADNEFIFSTRHILKNYDYSSLDRSWYKMASPVITPIWTDVYIFSTSKKPGINTAISLDINGELTGVISIAIELEDISLYLQTLKIGQTGTVFIIDTNNQLIASQNPEEIVFERVKGETPTLIKINETENEYITVANNTLNEKNIEILDIKSFISFNHNSSATNKSYFVTFMPVELLDWVMAIVIPTSDYMAEIERNSYILLIMVGITIIIAFIIIILLSNRLIVKPLLRITGEHKHVQNFDLDKIQPVLSHIKEINILSNSLIQMTSGLLSFQKYLPKELVQEMIAQGIEAELGGQEKELTILFSDIASFTKTFEKYGNNLIYQLGDYFGQMSRIIMENNGAIDKYIGDAIMAFWGAPKENKDHALHACKAALECKKLLTRLRIKWEKEEKPVLFHRIGLNTGTVMVGNMGYSKRLNYTVMGDPVNLASRIEGLNKMFQTEILIGQNTYNRVKEDIIARKVDTVTVYGKIQPVDVYELIATRDEISITDKFDWITTYETGLKLYYERKWQEAIQAFKRAVQQKGTKDYPSTLLAYYCKKFLEHPPDKNWTGITKLKTK